MTWQIANDDVLESKKLETECSPNNQGEHIRRVSSPIPTTSSKLREPIRDAARNAGRMLRTLYSTYI